ncbi:MAG: rhodanese-like domain-containing protein [Chitinophagaceae bacterium]|nr:rhodanese-like domain-containing protein [Chitinophagaceae bacterium]
MFNTIKKLFGLGPQTDFAALLQQGGIIVEVRSTAEYQSGHIKGSMKIPLQNLASNLSKIKKNTPLITCCASGMRSASAKSILKSNGFTEVHNGGGWMSLQNKI